MRYITIALALLKLAGVFADWFQERKWIDEGQKLAYAKALAEQLRKSGYADEALEYAKSKSDSELNDLLHDFEPRDPGSK